MKTAFRLLLHTATAIALAACAHPGATQQPAPVQVPAHASGQMLQIRWVNEISTSTDTLFSKGGLASLRELLLGKDPVRFNRPYAVHVDHRERIFVSDPQSHQVHLFDPAQRLYRRVRSGNGQQLVSPLGMASDEADRLYIADSVSGTVFRYDTERDRLEPFSKVRFERPTGLALDSFLQRLFVVDTLAHQVVVLNLEGVELYRFGRRGDAPGEFNYPTEIAVDITGRLLVNDTLNSRIQVFAPSGAHLLSFGMQGSGPGTFLRAKGIATDSSGGIYVSDALTDLVQVFDFRGRYVAAFGQSGNGPGEFWQPLGLFIDAQDRLYAVDVYNKRVQMFEGLTVAPRDHRSPSQ